MAALKDSIESFSTAVYNGAREQIMHFSVVSYIAGPDMIESSYFWSVSGVVKVCHFFLTATLSWGILCIMTRRASLHRLRGCAIEDVVACH
jgi:hypothetical protein